MLLLGALLFAVDRARRAPDARRVIVDAGVLRAIDLDHRRRLGRAPTAQERAVLVERWIDEEVRVREAERLGLAQGDVIVRRRLLQKMDQILDQTARLDPHAPPRVVRVERLSVEHVFFSRGRGDAERDARDAAAALTAGTDPATLGDPFPLGATLRARTRAQLTSALGDAAAASLWSSPDDGWRAVEGAAGWHAARVVGRTADEEREAGAADVEAARRDAQAKLRARYVVEVRR